MVFAERQWRRTRYRRGSELVRRSPLDAEGVAYNDGLGLRGWRAIGKVWYLGTATVWAKIASNMRAAGKPRYVIRLPEVMSLRKNLRGLRPKTGLTLPSFASVAPSWPAYDSSPSVWSSAGVGGDDAA